MTLIMLYSKYYFVTELFDLVVCLCFQLDIECLFSLWKCCEQIFRVYTTASICNLNFQSNNLHRKYSSKGLSSDRNHLRAFPFCEVPPFTAHCRRLRPESTILKVISFMLCYLLTPVSVIIFFTRFIKSFFSIRFEMENKKQKESSVRFPL